MKHCSRTRWWRLGFSACLVVLPAVALMVSRQPAGVPGGSSLVSSLPNSGTCSSPSAPAGTSSSPSLRLSGQTSWVRPGHQFTLDLSTAGGKASASGFAIYVEVFNRLLNRSDFDQTLCNQIPTPLLQTFGPVPMSALAPDPAQPGAVQFPIEVRTPGTASGSMASGSPKFQTTANVLNLTACSASCAGVYPVQVILEPVGGTNLLSELTSQLILTEPAPGSKPLALAWTLPVSAPPAFSATGKPTLSSAASAGIDTLAGAITAAQAVPLTLAASPITLAALAHSPHASDHRSLTDLATWASDPSHQVVALPYAPVSPAALVAAGLSSELAPQLSTGETLVDSTLRVHPDTSTWLSQGTLDQAGLNALEALPGRPVKHVVLSSTDLAPEQSTLQLTPTQPFALASQAGVGHQAPATYQLEAVTSDPGLALHLVNGPGAVLAAHQLLADLSMIYYDLPNASYSRGVVLQTPTAWQPDAAFLQVALGGLADSPIIQAVTLDQLFAQTPYGGMLIRQLSTSPPAPPSLPGHSIKARLQDLAAFASTLGPSPPSVLSSLNDLLLASESSDLSPSDRSLLLDQIRSLIYAQFSSVRLQTDTVTLTAQSAALPVTISSDLAYPVTAVLQLTSDKLGFGPRGTSRRVTLTQHQKTVEFEVRARATGKFPVQVSLVSPTGDLTLAAGRFAVRSSAISPVAIALTVAAGAVLAGWWGRTLIRGRRSRNRRLVAPTPAA
jgi:hypothetical protein